MHMFSTEPSLTNKFDEKIATKSDGLDFYERVTKTDTKWSCNSMPSKENTITQDSEASPFVERETDGTQNYVEISSRNERSKDASLFGFNANKVMKEDFDEMDKNLSTFAKKSIKFLEGSTSERECDWSSSKLIRDTNENLFQQDKDSNGNYDYLAKTNTIRTSAVVASSPFYKYTEIEEHDGGPVVEQQGGTGTVEVYEEFLLKRFEDVVDDSVKSRYLDVKQAGQDEGGLVRCQGGYQIYPTSLLCEQEAKRLKITEFSSHDRQWTRKIAQDLKAPSNITINSENSVNLVEDFEGEFGVVNNDVILMEDQNVPVGCDIESSNINKTFHSDDQLLQGVDDITIFKDMKTCHAESMGKERVQEIIPILTRRYPECTLVQECDIIPKVNDSRPCMSPEQWDLLSGGNEIFVVDVCDGDSKDKSTHDREESVRIDDVEADYEKDEIFVDAVCDDDNDDSKHDVSHDGEEDVRNDVDAHFGKDATVVAAVCDKQENKHDGEEDVRNDVDAHFGKDATVVAAVCDKQESRYDGEEGLHNGFDAHYEKDDIVVFAVCDDSKHGVSYDGKEGVRNNFDAHYGKDEIFVVAVCDGGDDDDDSKHKSSHDVEEGVRIVVNAHYGNEVVVVDVCDDNADSKHDSNDVRNDMIIDNNTDDNIVKDFNDDYEINHGEKHCDEVVDSCHGDDGKDFVVSTNVSNVVDDDDEIYQTQLNGGNPFEIDESEFQRLLQSLDNSFEIVSDDNEEFSMNSSEKPGHDSPGTQDNGSCTGTDEEEIKETPGQLKSHFDYNNSSINSCDEPTSVSPETQDDSSLCRENEVRESEGDQKNLDSKNDDDSNNDNVTEVNELEKHDEAFNLKLIQCESSIESNEVFVEGNDNGHVGENGEIEESQARDQDALKLGECNVQVLMKSDLNDDEGVVQKLKKQEQHEQDQTEIVQCDIKIFVESADSPDDVCEECVTNYSIGKPFEPRPDSSNQSSIEFSRSSREVLPLSEHSEQNSTSSTSSLSLQERIQNVNKSFEWVRNELREMRALDFNLKVQFDGLRQEVRTLREEYDLYINCEYYDDDEIFDESSEYLPYETEQNNSDKLHLNVPNCNTVSNMSDSDSRTTNPLVNNALREDSGYHSDTPSSSPGTASNDNNSPLHTTHTHAKYYYQPPPTYPKLQELSGGKCVFELLL